MIDVIFPVLNEAKALPWLLGRMPDGFRAIVVDNASTDGSGAIATYHGADVITESRKGFGWACWAGLQVARSDVIAFCDADASFDPQDLPLVVNAVLIGDQDLVLGARMPVEKGAWPLHARLANRWLAKRVGHATGVEISDLGPMRAMHRDALMALGMEDRRFGWPLEMVVKAAKADWRICEVAIPYYPRTGRSKVTGTLMGTVRAARDMGAILAACR